MRNTFDTVERAIRFNLSGCFQKFTEEVKLQDPEDASIHTNDWHIYTEYGANDPRMILLQRMDYSRGSAKYIVEHGDTLIVGAGENEIVLSLAALEECEFGSIATETESIKLNYPESFR